MAKSTLVINIRPRGDEAVKPTELIQVTGHHALGLAARRMITLLWHSAHKQGIEENKDYTIPLPDLRTDRHHGSDQIKETIKTLMTTLIEVRDHTGNAETTVQVLGGNDMFKKGRKEGLLTYSFDKRLIWILKDSEIWGKISLPILMAFSTKYAVSLYENIAHVQFFEHHFDQAAYLLAATHLFPVSMHYFESLDYHIQLLSLYY